MNWKHKCSLEWLSDRQLYLTASDIKRLLPFTPSGRKRKVGEEDMYKVLADKVVNLTEEDCMSYGAMARGHILEPYAVQDLNDMLAAEGIDEHFWHWDDELVWRSGREIAFSPDAMDVPMGKPGRATMLAEIKSYTPERHIATLRTPKLKIEERWQIATAMALLPDIKKAYLVLYNPSIEAPKLAAIPYRRAWLQAEIDTILGIEEQWAKFVDGHPLASDRITGNPDVLMYSHGHTEEQIEKEVAEYQRLNPVV